jgi:hypothetical protein
MVKKPSEMTYDEIVAERQINAVKKDKYKSEIKAKKDPSTSLKINPKILKLAKKNEALAKQQLDLLKIQKSQAQAQAQAHIEPELESKPESVEKSNKKSKKVKKPIDMPLEEIRAELKNHNERISSLESHELQSKDFETRFQAKMEIQRLTPLMKRLGEQEISLLKHQIACLKNGGL